MSQKLVYGLFLCFLAFNCFPAASGSGSKKKLVTEEGTPAGVRNAPAVFSDLFPSASWN